MKILKLLSSLLPFIIYLAFFQFQSISFSNEAVDIWNIEKKVIEENNVEENLELENIMVQPVDNLNDEILRDENLTKSEISLVGIYDPEEYSLTIDMWSNSDGNNIKSILNRIDQENLSEDSISILDIALLTNSYSPRFNISENEFNNFKINYLIKKRDFKQIENFINLNPNLEENKKLIKFYADFFLTNSNIDKACSILLNKNLFNDNYLIKFKIYCLIHDNNKEEAQLIYDLQVENGFDDIFFEKIQYFNELPNENNENVSEKNIYHLSHSTSKNFNFIPSETTDQIIGTIFHHLTFRRCKSCDLDNEEKIKVVEKATHQKIIKKKIC